ncbi:hypothetical protein GCM10011498_32010 [Amylibacter cionae]|uniref:Response regulatory domain-containing protein n=1 Tax=Neptunicoccus cionae TaxID=2035344 RepID=A0A916R1W8_9RHOB|nr:hypothetical protein GCM10011498_32010 [Amylibacter cionae]
MRILIADDHDLVRDTIAAYIQSDPENTVAPAANLQDALDHITKDVPSIWCFWILTCPE